MSRAPRKLVAELGPGPDRALPRGRRAASQRPCWRTFLPEALQVEAVSHFLKSPAVPVKTPGEHILHLGLVKR